MSTAPIVPLTDKSHAGLSQTIPSDTPATGSETRRKISRLSRRKIVACYHAPASQGAAAGLRRMPMRGGHGHEHKIQAERRSFVSFSSGTGKAQLCLGP